MGHDPTPPVQTTAHSGIYKHDPAVVPHKCAIFGTVHIHSVLDHCYQFNVFESFNTQPSNMAFAVSRSAGTTGAYGVCLKAPVLPRLRHGKAVQRVVPTVAPPSALANDQESVAPASMWSRTKDFMSSKAPKLFAALMLAAVLVRIRHFDCSLLGSAQP